MVEQGRFDLLHRPITRPPLRAGQAPVIDIRGKIDLDIHTEEELGHVMNAFIRLARLNEVFSGTNKSRTLQAEERNLCIAAGTRNLEISFKVADELNLRIPPGLVYRARETIAQYKAQADSFYGNSL